VIDPGALGELLRTLRRGGQQARAIGTVQAGGSGVVYDLGSAPAGEGDA
jgi:hypothetical protein